MSDRERTLYTVWAVVAAIAIAVQLGGYPLLDADEGRNGEVGREMAATNDYVMPRLDALPYLDKPIVYFAAEAAAMEVFGATEFAARLPAWLFTVATALLLAWFAGRVGIEPAATAIIFLSMPLTIAFARTVIFDSALAFFITVAIVGFYLAIEAPHPPSGHLLPASGAKGVEPANSSRPAERGEGGTERSEVPGEGLWSAVAWASIGLGVITKGPVALALPLIVALPYAIWRRRFRALWSWLGLVLFVLAIAPWVWAISRAVPDFLQYVLVTETAQRLTTGALKRTGPPWYFIPYLIGGAFPWSIAVFRRATGWLDRYLILWIGVPFVFFSLSQSKRPQYILPLMAAMALFAARRWQSKAAAIVLAAFGALLCIAVPFLKLRLEYASAARTAALIVGIAALICGAVATWRPKFGLIALSIPTLLIPAAANPLMNALAVRRSEKAFVARLPPGEVIGIRAFTGSMAFYLRRPIPVITPDGEEFTSNYIIRHYSRFASDPAGMLRPVSSLPGAFVPGRVLIVRNDDRATRALAEQHGGRVAAASAHFVAYTIPR